MIPKTIFISHISEERELAQILKQELEVSFLGMINVFVSSDDRSIGLGTRWLDEITTALQESVAMIVLCSPQSTSKPWINFEAGAGWSRRKIEVVPFCHSDMTPDELVLPIGLLEGMQGNDPIKLEALFKMIARHLGGIAPKLEWVELASRIKCFEDEYALEQRILRPLKNLKLNCQEVFDIICEAGICEEEILPKQVLTYIADRSRLYLDELVKTGHFFYNYGSGSVRLSSDFDGSFTNHSLKVTIRPRLAEALKSLQKP